MTMAEVNAMVLVANVVVFWALASHAVNVGAKSARAARGPNHDDRHVGCTRAEVAAALGVSMSTVRRYEVRYSVEVYDDPISDGVGTPRKLWAAGELDRVIGEA